jgi:hypothetical protein
MKHESHMKTQSLNAGSMKRATNPLAGAGRRRFANARVQALEKQSMAAACPSQNGAGRRGRACSIVGSAATSGVICRNVFRVTSGLRT